MLTNQRILQKITYQLNTKPMQFVESKTRDLIETIKYVKYMRYMRGNHHRHGVHDIFILVTDKSLEQTDQLKDRLMITCKNDPMFNGTNIQILSSVSDDMKSVDSFLSSFMKCKTLSDLPDVLIMCTHSKRFEDITEIVSSLNDSREPIPSKLGIHQISLSIAFDEADKHITQIVDLLKDIDEIVEEQGNYLIENIQFITATPFKKFWKIMEEYGINKLKNINRILREKNIVDDEDSDSDSNIVLDSEKLELCINNYINQKSHRIHSDFKKISCSGEVLNHIRSVMPKLMLDYIGRRKEHGPLTIFTPGSTYTDTHFKIKELFHSYSILDDGDPMKKDYVVLVHNGKKEGRTFYYPDGKTETLKSFIKKYSLKGKQLMNILATWRQVHPDEHLVITGNNTIGRGITFNTTGFNFTDAIISSSITSSLEEMLQIWGRLFGHIDYVDIMDIWCTEGLDTEVSETMELLLNTLRSDKEDYCATDFRKPTQRELIASLSEEPIVKSIDPEKFVRDFGIGGENTPITTHTKPQQENARSSRVTQWDHSYIMNEYLEPHERELFMSYKKDQCTRPGTNNSYKKQILDIVEGRTKCVSIAKKKRKENLFQIFIDDRNYRLIFCRYTGSKLGGNMPRNIRTLH